MGTMPAYLEAPGALERLRGEGIRLGVLSQSAAAAADSVLRFAGLRDRLELVMSAQDAGAYKPDPRPYRMALERLGAEADDVVFVATHWWDVAGAKCAGLRTGWVARRERSLLDTVPTPDFTGRDLTEVAEAIVAS
jgi:2-haloacid dehalogenase